MSRPLVKTVQMTPILLLTLGWFGLEMAMALDVSQFQFLLNTHLEEATWIGAVLSLGPLAGITVQPAMGWLSDAMAHKGFSRPVLMKLGLAGTMLSVLAMALNPGLVMLVVMIGLFFVSINVLMVSYRALVTETSSRRALLNHKGVISGFVALFSGAGGFMMLVLCGFTSKTAWPYIIAAVMLLATFGLFFVKGPRPKRLANEDFSEDSIPAGLLKPVNLTFYAFPLLGYLPSMERAIGPEETQRQIFRLFTVQFFSWIGIQALRAYFALYVVHALKFDERTANLLMALITMVIVISAVPLGKLADRRDNRLLLRFSLLAFGTISLLSYVLIDSLPMAVTLCALLGFSFAGLIVFPLSMLMKLCPPRSEGTYAGLYNLFISSPPLPFVQPDHPFSVPPYTTVSGASVTRP